MIFALGPNPILVIALLGLFAIVPIAVALPLGTLVLRGACSIVNIIFPEPDGTDGVPVPRFRKAMGTFAVALVCGAVGWGTLVGCPVPFVSHLSPAFGFIAMSAAAASMLGAPLWKAAVAMVITIAVTCIPVVPIAWAWWAFLF